MIIENLQPLFDRVLIKRLVNEKTDSGIYIPDVAQEKSQMGIVVAIGTGKVLASGNILSLTVKIHDIVYFNKFAGLEVNEDYLILKEEEILGIIK